MEKEKNEKNQDAKFQIRREIESVIKQLIHPQAKDSYDSDTEDEIVARSKRRNYLGVELILATKKEGDDLNKIVRNYVLKMKVRNKIGLKLSRWVAYKELPRALLRQQIPAQDSLPKSASANKSVSSYDNSSHLKGSGYETA